MREKQIEPYLFLEQAINTAMRYLINSQYKYKLYITDSLSQN